jgi:hypothetical protein
VAKLVPAICPKCGANVQLDPEREFVTCQFCGASSFIQTQKRQPTAYVQAHAVPVIQVQHAAGFLSGCSGAIVVAAVLLGIAGAAVAGVVAYFSASAVTAVAPPPVAVPGAPADAKPQAATSLIEEDYYANPMLAISRYQKALGKPIIAKQLTLLQYYATLEAQDPKNPEHVDSYKLWANVVERPQPVQLGGAKRELDKLLFSLDSVDFKLLPGIIKQALAELKIEEGKVQVISLSKDAQSKEPVWRVVVNGSRDNGVADFSATGKKLKIYSN